jgi:hypothetical protein
MANKLWTGKTARQELAAALPLIASVHGITVSYALEVALDGADSCPDGSPKREMLRCWDGMSGDAQQRLLGQARTEARRQDRILGRRIDR